MVSPLGGYSWSRSDFQKPKYSRIHTSMPTSATKMAKASLTRTASGAGALFFVGHTVTGRGHPTAPMFASNCSSSLSTGPLALRAACEGGRLLQISLFNRTKRRVLCLLLFFHAFLCLSLVLSVSGSLQVAAKRQSAVEKPAKGRGSWCRLVTQGAYRIFLGIF